MNTRPLFLAVIFVQSALRNLKRFTLKTLARFPSPEPSTRMTRLVDRIERAIQDEIRRHTLEEFWLTHYGAFDIHPRHLVYWIVVQSDREKSRLQSDGELMAKLRDLLDLYLYPAEGKDYVAIGFESHETVDQVADGNFYKYWK